MVQSYSEAKKAFELQHRSKKHGKFFKIMNDEFNYINNTFENEFNHVLYVQEVVVHFIL